MQLDNYCYSEKRDFLAQTILAVLGGGVGVMVEPILFFPAMERRGWSNPGIEILVSISLEHRHSLSSLSLARHPSA